MIHLQFAEACQEDHIVVPISRDFKPSLFLGRIWFSQSKPILLIGLVLSFQVFTHGSALIDMPFHSAKFLSE